MRRFAPLKALRCLSQEPGRIGSRHIQKKNAYTMHTFFLNQRLPILPGGLPPSTFGVCGLNCCVRHGNRWIPAAIATEFLKGPCPYNCIKRTSLTSLRSAYGSFLRTCFQIPSPTPFGSKRLAPVCASLLSSFKQGSLLKSSPRSISTGPLRASLHFHSRPIYHVVFMGPYLLSQ